MRLLTSKPPAIVLKACLLCTALTSTGCHSEVTFPQSSLLGTSLSFASANGTDGEGGKGTGDAEPTGRNKGSASFVIEGRVDLGRAIHFGLRQNLNIRITEVRRRASSQNIDMAKAEFDPQLFASAYFEEPAGDTSILSTETGITTKLMPGTVVQVGARALASRVKHGADASISGSSRLTTAQLLAAFLPNVFENGGMGEADSGGVEEDATSEVFASIQQPLLRGGGWAANRAPITIARLMTKQADLAVRAQILEFVRGAEIAYWSSSAARSMIELEKRSLQRSREVLKTVTDRRELQDAILVDVLEAEAAVAELEANLQEIQKRFQDAQDDLWLLLGFPVNHRNANYVFDSLDSYVPMRIGSVDPEFRYEQALTTYPDVLLLLNMVQRKRAEVIRAKRDALPRLDIGVNAGYRRDAAGLSGAFPDKLFWGGAIEFSMPWNLRAERARLAQVREELFESELAKQQGERELMRSIRESCRDVRLRHQQVGAVARAASATERKWEQMDLRYRQGLVSVRDLLEAEEEAREARRRELETQLGLVAAESELAQLDGSLLSRHAMDW